MKIVCLDKVPLSAKNVCILSEVGILSYPDTDPQSDAEAIKRIKDANIVISYWYKFPQKFFEASPKLKLLCVSALDWIAVDYARKHNILIQKISGYATEAVAEHAISLMLLALRKTHKAILSVKKGIWQSEKGQELQGKTLGIIGNGTIGKRISEIVQNGFGMSVISISSKYTDQEFTELLQKSDIISVNATLNQNTKYMLDEKEFSQMKDGVTIINTARGNIIYEEALIKYLKSGKIAAAGLDVLSQEPITSSNKLLNFPNVVITPHMGYNTLNSDYRFGDMVTEYIVQYIHSNI